MAISKIAGQMLKDNLERDGANLAITDTIADTPVLFVDVVNGQIGINNATPSVALDISGNVLAGNITTTELLSTGTANVANLQVAGNATVDEISSQETLQYHQQAISTSVQITSTMLLIQCRTKTLLQKNM